MKNKYIRIVLLCVMVAMIALVAFLTIKVVSQVYSNKIDIVEAPERVAENVDEIIDEKKEVETKNISIYKEEKKLDEVINILLIGLDARTYDTVSRSDSMILVSYNTKNHTAKLVSVMRDTWAYIPEHGWSRINAATVYGGIGLLINTLNTDFDLDIQNYVQIKFDDFKKVIDLLGGIDVDLTSSEIKYINGKLHSDDNDYSNDITAEPGLVHLNGTQALWHCRNRTIGNADFERTERQREVLGILVDKGLNMSALEAGKLLYEITNYVNTNLPISTVIALVNDALISKNITIESYRIPFDNTFSYATKNGASVLDVDIQKNAELLHEALGYEGVVNIELPAQPKTREEKAKEEKAKEEAEAQKQEQIQEEQNIVEVPTIEVVPEDIFENPVVENIENIENVEN